MSLDALRKAGVLAQASISTFGTTSTALLATMTSSDAAASRSRVATSALHVAIPQCTRCHNLDKQRCDTCHKPLHKVLPTANGCSSCHRPGVKWAFTHPTAEPACAACHKSPANHFPGQCSICHHAPGVSFKNASFGHTDPTCTSCHTAPAGHYGSACSSCHSPGRAFASATINHPTVQHGWKAWACVKCHPNGYASHSCTTCHGPNGGGD